MLTRNSNYWSLSYKKKLKIRSKEKTRKKFNRQQLLLHRYIVYNNEAKVAGDGSTNIYRIRPLI